jgi:hypothetical protein
MSLIYYLLFTSNVSLGRFFVGRFVDLLQQDIIIALLVVIAIYTVKRWNKLWK